MNNKAHSLLWNLRQLSTSLPRSRVLRIYPLGFGRPEVVHSQWNPRNGLLTGFDEGLRPSVRYLSQGISKSVDGCTQTKGISHAAVFKCDRVLCPRRFSSDSEHSLVSDGTSDRVLMEVNFPPTSSEDVLTRKARPTPVNHKKLAQECNSLSDVLDTFSKAPTFPGSSYFLAMWTIAKRVSEDKRRFEIQLMFSHPAFSQLCEQMMREAKIMHYDHLLFSLNAIVKLGIPQNTLMVQTLLRTIQTGFLLVAFGACPRTRSVDKAVLELTETCLPLPPECWD